MLSPEILETLDAIQAELNADGADTVPDGWFTVVEYARAKQVSDQHAGKQLRAMAAAGRIRMEKYRIAIDGKLRRVQHFYVG